MMTVEEAVAGRRSIRAFLPKPVPRALIERPKQGFSVPLGAWLRGSLRAWADDLLAPATLRRGDWLEPEPIAVRWREHRSGQRDWSQSLWAVLMLQSWLAGEVARGACPPPDQAPKLSIGADCR